MLTPEQEKTYTRNELGLFNLIDQPVWVFDIVKKAMWFANTAAVELWSATSLQNLLERNFSDDMSEATARRLDDYLVKFRQGERLNDQCTYSVILQNACQVNVSIFGRLVPFLTTLLAILSTRRDVLSQWTRSQNR